MADGEQPNGLWRVTDQRHTTEVTTGGRFLDVMEVTITTNSGASFPVKIPLENYNADAVIRYGNAYAAEVERVATLGQT